MRLFALGLTLSLACVGAADWDRPRALAADSSGNVWIVDSAANTLSRLSPSGALTVVPGLDLREPSGIAIDRDGAVVVADSGRGRLLKVSPGGAFSVLTSSGLGRPCGLAVDALGALYIADSQSHRIRKRALNGALSTIAGTGSAGYSGDDGLATAARLFGPEAIAFDGSGNLYIADRLNHRVRVVFPSGVIRTVAGSGVAGTGGLNAPSSVNTDTRGNLFIADTGNHRILALQTDGSLLTVASPGLDAPSAALPQPDGLWVADNGSLRRVTNPLAERPTVANAASGEPGLVAGSLAELTGASRATSVWVNGLQAPVLASSPNQILFQTPWELAGRTSASVVAMDGPTIVADVDVPVLAAQPGIYRTAGRHAAALNHRTGRLVSSADPANPGDVLTLWATGLGPVAAQQTTGIASDIPTYLTDSANIEVGAQLADILYAGLAPGKTGLYQINLRVPEHVQGERLLVRVGGAAGEASLAVVQPGGWVETFDSLDPVRWIRTDKSSTVGTSTSTSCKVCNTSVFDPLHASVLDGMLILRLDQAPESYASLDRIRSVGGEVETASRFSYGTYEYRMRAPCVAGGVSAAFSFTGNSQTEIDIEILGSDRNLVRLSTWYNPSNGALSTKNPPTESSSAGTDACGVFHIYGYRWEPGKVTFSVDGTEVANLTKFVPTAAAPLMLNHWGTANAAWGGIPAGESLTAPRFFYVDWVRYTPLAQ